MAIKGENQRANGVIVWKVVPLFGPRILGQRDPCVRSTQFGLRVRLHGISLLRGVTFQHAPNVGGLASLHCRWATGQLLKQRNLFVLVSNVTAVENGPALELTIGIVLIQLGVLLHENREDPSKVSLLL